MQDFIIDLLKNSATDGWSVQDKVNEGWEFYFIRHRLDQNRVRHTEHILLKVYKKSADGLYLGSASAELSPTANQKTAGDLINALVEEAKLVKNPVYSLREPETAPNAAAEPKIAVEEIASSFIKALREVPETAAEDINSYEIFVDKVQNHFRTSTGIDVAYAYPHSMVEVVVNARNKEHEIELYRMYVSGTADVEQIKKEIIETLRYGRDKLAAEKTPTLGQADVVLSTDAALQVYQYFIERMTAEMKYQKISDWELGEPVAKGAVGDLVTVKALKYLENSSANASYDPEGGLRRDLTLIEKGIAKNYFGSRQFSEYLGLKDSFIPANFAVSGGTKSAEEIRKGKFLEIVEFSDFQVSSFNGDIFGEIRLGYLHDGEKVQIVEGGSVSGTMRNFALDMQMSKEQKQYNNLLIPAVTRLKNVSITGCEI